MRCQQEPYVIPAKRSASWNPGWIPVFAEMTNRDTARDPAAVLSHFQTFSKSNK